MSPNDLLDLVRRRPFFPFRIYLTDGKTYDVRHPERILVLESRAVVAVGGHGDIGEGTEHIALVNIARIEELEEARSN